jgi:arsenate reductase
MAEVPVLQEFSDSLLALYWIQCLHYLSLERPMTVEIYHNPRCSKSRQALQLLEERGVQPKITRYLETPPTRETLDKILEMLGMEPRDLMRKKEKEYKEAGLDDPNLSRGQLIQAMVDHPRLIERPIVIKDGQAALGRPPESVLEII